MEIFWDITQGATLGRGQWVIDNCPEVSVEDAALHVGLQPEQITSLDLSSRPTTNEAI